MLAPRGRGLDQALGAARPAAPGRRRSAATATCRCASGCACCRPALALEPARPRRPAARRRLLRDWLAEHGQSERAVDRLWNLIALPTLNVPAAEASLALATKVFRVGLLDRPDAGDIGWSAVPLGRAPRGHRRPRARGLRRRGGAGRARCGAVEPPAPRRLRHHAAGAAERGRRRR